MTPAYTSFRPWPGGVRAAWMGYLLVGLGLWGSLLLCLGSLGPAVALKLSLALLGVSAVVVGLRRPVVGGMLLLFLLYTRLADVALTYHGLPLIQPLVVLLASATFVRRAKAGGTRSLAAHRGLWCAMALYGAVLLASVVWAEDTNSAAQRALEFLKNSLPIVYVIAEALGTPRAVRLAVWSLIGAGTLLAGLSVLQAITHTYANSYWGLAQAPIREITVGADSQRSSGSIGDPNFYALILVGLVPLTLMRIRDEHRWVLRCIAMAALAVLMAALMLTYSRGGALTLAAVMLLYVPLARVRPIHVLAVLLLLIPLAGLTPASYWHRVTMLGSLIHVTGVQGDHSLQYRVGSGQIALEMFADHPLTGVGAGNYPATYFPYATRLNVPRAASYAHDLYLQIAAETGLLGLLTFGAAVALAFRACWRSRAAAHRAGDRVAEGLITSCLLSLLAYVIGCAFLPAAYPRYLWMTIGLVMAVALTRPESSAHGLASRALTVRSTP